MKMQHRGESRIMHEEQILEAIDQLRRRKARPDADRICNYLLRKCSVDARDTIADLHRLIEAEKVIQVDYKGNTSYRNASKWSRLQLYKNKPEGFVKEKLNSFMLTGAVAELVVAEPDYLDQGVPAERLIEQLLNGSTNPTTRRVVDDFLTKEVASGNLTRLNNGNYSLVASDDMTHETTEHQTTTTTTTAATTTANTTTTTVYRENGNSGGGKRNNLSMVNTYDFHEFEEDDHDDEEDDDDDMTVTDSRSITPRSSRQTSPKQQQQQQDQNLKKEDCYEIIVGSKQSLHNSLQRENNNLNSSNAGRSRGSRLVEVKEVVENTAVVNGASNNHSNLKRGSKSERKQRLEVRNEEPVEIEIKYAEHYHPRESKDERDRERERREEAEQFSEERDDDDAGRSSTNPSPTPSSNNAGNFRSARRKRAKKVFDPSDNNLVRRKRGRQPGTQNKATVVSPESQEVVKPSTKDSPQWHCSLCAKQKQERLVACRDCTVRAHPSCIYSPEELIHKLDSSWQCERCKSCTVCCETSDAGALITCYSCDEAYHSSCHTPRISVQKSSSKWHCSNCVQKHCKPNVVQNFASVGASRPTTPSHPSVLPPVLSPQVSPARGSSDQMEDDGPRDGIDPNIPDASDWTSEQVYQYFARLFPKEAEVFRQQDIDGHSLLLMKRSDVLTSMDLLLGPALKIYRHVLKLQVRRDDPRLYWL